MKNRAIIAIQFFLIAIAPCFAFAYSASPTMTTSGGGTWGSILRMTISISGSNASFSVTKIDGNFVNQTDVWLKKDNSSSDPVYDVQHTTINAGSATAYFHNVNLSTLIPAGGATNFYIRIWNNLGHAWVGPITVCNRPSIPTGLTANATGQNSIQLTWGTVTGATSYKLWRDTSLNGSFSHQIAWPTGTQHTDSGTHLSCGTTYYYKVSVENNCGSSGKSNAVAATTHNCPPPTPTISSVTPSVIYRGATNFDMVITGTNFSNVVSGFPKVYLGSGVVIGNNAVTMDSSTRLTVRVTQVISDTAVGYRDAEVKNSDTAKIIKANAFSVADRPPPTPTISSVTPSVIYRGDTNFDMVITGTNFSNVVSGFPKVYLGSGVVIGNNAVTMDSSTRLTVRVTQVISDTAVGYRDAEVKNSDTAKIIKENAFRIADPVDSPESDECGQQLVDRARIYLGSTHWGTGSNTLCAQFIRDMIGRQLGLPSAIEIYRHYEQKGLVRPMENNIPLGSVLFYDQAPENGKYGHVGLYSGYDRIISITSRGVTEDSIYFFNAPLLGYTTRLDYCKEGSYFSGFDEYTTCNCIQNQHTVTTIAGSGGTVTPNSRTVDHGSTASFTVTPDTGYTHGRVGGICPVGGFSDDTYTTGVITSDCSVNFTFVQQTGALRITIEPEEAVANGAKWNIFNIYSDHNVWYESGEVVSNLPAGEQYTVIYKPMEGWRRPEPHFVVVHSGQTTSGRGEYLPGTPPAIMFEQIGDQRSGEPFEVTISVRDGSGLVTTANGSLNLSASIGQVTIEDSRGIVLRNGTWSGRVILEACAEGITLRASGFQGMANNSEAFSVTGCVEPVKVMLWLSVTDRERVPQADASYALWHWPRAREDAHPILRGIVNENGQAFIGHLDPGWYTISAAIDKDGRSFTGEATVTIDEHRCATANVIVRSSRKPLLVVPGIMGSTTVPLEQQDCRAELRTCVVPTLPPDVTRGDLHLLDPRVPFWGRVVGVLSFEEIFSEDFEVFRVPWDWRIDVKEAWKEFLKPAIEDAKKATGHDSVDIVAHSMGGLLVREYMQQPELYEGDVDRFVMVGTPNEGSSNTYIMEEGGDPRLADDIQSYFKALLAVPFYTSALEMDMRNRNGQVEEAPAAIRRYLKNHVPTLNQLSPVYPFLISMTDEWFNPESARRYEAKCSPNSYLKEANFDLPLLYQNRFPNNKTRLFVSTSERTLFLNIVLEIPEECDPDVLYGSGEYMGFTRSSGDGTVLADKAANPFERLHSGNNDIVVMDDFGGHAGMLGNERLQRAIYAFLLPGRAFPTARLQRLNQARSARETALAEERRLSISIRGDVQPLIVSADGQQVGVQPGTLEFLEEFGQSSLATFRGGTHLSITNIDPQRYMVRLHGRSGSDFTVHITWISGETALEGSVRGHHEGGVTEFEIDLGADDWNDVIIHPLEAPKGITAREEHGNTVISWSAASNPLVTGYRIYGRPPGWPDFRRIGSTTASEFVTRHPWNDRQDQVGWIYMVTSVAADGSISFYEGTAINRTPAFLIRNSAGEIIDGRYFLADRGQPFHFTLDGGSGLFEIVATVSDQPLSDVIEDQGEGAFTFTAEGTLVARITVTDTRTGVSSWFTLEVQSTGSLTITIEPAEARLAGAQWRRIGTTTWRNSADTESNVPVGSHPIEFREIGGWNTPSSLTLMVSVNETVTATGTYTPSQQTGALRVNIQPQGAITAGAQWRRTGTMLWHNSGHTETGIATGSHSVEFKEISGWVTPDRQTVTVVKDSTATVWAEYSPEAEQIAYIIAIFSSAGIRYYSLKDGDWQDMYPFYPYAITAGDLDGDGIDDVIGAWQNAGVFAFLSGSRQWINITSFQPDGIAAGDMTGNGRTDLIGSWRNFGLYYRNSVTGAWPRLVDIAPEAVAAGDVTGDGRNEMVGSWPGYGIYARNVSNSWARISRYAPPVLGLGDMTGDGRKDYLCSWPEFGFYYLNSVRGDWWLLNDKHADIVAAGDLTGDGRDEVVAVFEDGVWIYYVAARRWEHISTEQPDAITTGRLSFRDGPF